MQNFALLKRNYYTPTLNFSRVLDTFKEGNLPGVPIHLRNATTKLDKDLDYGKGYSYNLSEVGGIEYMPEGMEDVTFF